MTVDFYIKHRLKYVKTNTKVYGGCRANKQTKLKLK